MEDKTDNQDFIERYERYSKLSDEELIALHLKHANNPGWTRTRMNHEIVLSRAFKKRSIDRWKIKKPNQEKS